MPHLTVLPSSEALARAVAERFLERVTAVLSHRPGDVHVALTGGSMGIATLRQVRALSAGFDWSRVQLWWGDERWLPAGDAERNDTQADQALIAHITIPATHVHRFAGSDAGVSLEQAAEAYAAALATQANNGESHPVFDLVFLGVGPDGHVASLFPGFEQLEARATLVLPVRNSPKPPPERLTLTLPLLNSARSVWLMLAGAEKADALNQAKQPTAVPALPVSRVHGTEETVLFADAAAASPR